MKFFVSGAAGQVGSHVVDEALGRGDEVVGIRPEDVSFSMTQVSGSYPATVELVVPRGHFHEVYLKRADASLRAFVSANVPQVGDTGFAKVAKALVYKDGKLVRTA